MKISQQVRKARAGLELADILRKKYRTVKYDTKSGRGTVSMGPLQATWQDSQNEDKIYLTLSAKDIRAFNGEQAAQGLFAIHKALGSFD